MVVYPSRSAQHGNASARRRTARIQVPQYLMGKQSYGYTIHEIRYILQHYGHATGTLHDDKTVLLARLAAVVKKHGITRDDRIWILKDLQLDPDSAVRYQEMDHEGNYVASTYPNGVHVDEIVARHRRALEAQMATLQEELTDMKNLLVRMCKQGCCGDP